MPYPVLGLLQEQFTTLLPSAIVLHQHYNECSPQTLAARHVFPNLLEIQGKSKIGWPLGLECVCEVARYLQILTVHLVKNSHREVTSFSQDGCEACYTALEAGRQSMDNCSSNKLEDPTHKRACLHRWPFIQATAKIPVNTQDISRMLKSLQPLLQDTLQKRTTNLFWQSVSRVRGPLTWKDFHLMAQRGKVVFKVLSV